MTKKRQDTNISQMIFDKGSFWIFLTLLLVEAFSFLGSLFPLASIIIYPLILLITLILSLKELRYGLLIILAELFIGSMGYLFYIKGYGLDFLPSIRISLWLIVMSVWFGKLLLHLIAKDPGKKTIFNDFSLFKRTELPYFVGIFLFIIWGIINGYLNKNSIYIFFDFNNWLYLLLIFPVYHVFFVEKEKNILKDVAKIFFVCSIWLSIKTLLLEYIFSHKMVDISRSLYQWVRDTRVGEITIMESGFTRIFFQSHIFILIAFFCLAFFLSKLLKAQNGSLFNFRSPEAKKVWKTCLLLILVISVILISFSRSFWVASAITFLFYLILTMKKHGPKILYRTLIVIFISSLFSLTLISLIIKFPYPKPDNIRFTEALSDRATNIAGESAVSSRYKLWPKLMNKIKETPVLGSGFGTTVTYESSDPRILSSTVDGQYTTFAFEWGWLDIWLKLGIFGLLFYLLVLLRLVSRALMIRSWIGPFVASTIILLMIVNFFTPYLNHPLGLGPLLLAGVIIDALKDKDKPLATK